MNQENTDSVLPKDLGNQDNRSHRHHHQRHLPPMDMIRLKIQITRRREKYPSPERQY